MTAAGKKIDARDAFVGMVIAVRLSGKSRLFLLTRIVAGELEAKHEAGRTIISRASLDRLIATLSKKARR